jgi:hypothetical protein
LVFIEIFLTPPSDRSANGGRMNRFRRHNMNERRFLTRTGTVYSDDCFNSCSILFYVCYVSLATHTHTLTTYGRSTISHNIRDGSHL